MIDYQLRFEQALPYADFLQVHGTEEHRRRWQDVYDSFTVSAAQAEVLRSFTRRINVLCLAGAWCGDCVRQCPILQRFAEVSDRIRLCFVDRDADPDLSSELRICGGNRVPVVVFLSEDYAECGRYGDRTLSRYREMTAQQLGPACPTGLGGDQASAEEVADDWLREFERINLMLRLSPRLRERHGD